MLGKLIKYEIKATSRTFLMIYAAVLGLAVLNRIFYSFDFDALSNYSEFGWMAGVFVGLFTLVYVLMIIAMFVTVMIVVIMRYYKNMFTNEGYLTLTLPVRPWQHITAKAAVSAIWMFVSIAVTLLSIIVMLSHGEVLYAFRVGYGELQEALRNADFPFLPFIAELLVAILISMVGYALPIYACITIGQQWKKHRVLGAFCAYLVMNFATQVITGIATGAMSVSFFRAAENFDSSYEMFSEHFLKYMHFIMIFSIVVSVLLYAAYFFICNYLLEKKLDLE